MNISEQPKSHFAIHLLSFPINLVLEIFIHLTSLILPITLVMKGWETHNIFLTSLAVLLALYLYPLAILLLSAIIMRFLPKPPRGYIDTLENRFKYEILIALSTLVRRSPARGLLMLPFSNFYYQLAGTKIDSSAIICDPDCIHDLYLVSVGKNSVLGWGSLVLGHCLPEPSQALLGAVEIGDDVLVGARSLIWPNVKVGDRSIIQNGSVVRPGTIIPPDEIWGGIPASKIRDRQQNTKLSFSSLNTQDKIISDLQAYLKQNHHLENSVIDTPLSSLGLKPEDISRFLVYCEKNYQTFVDRTQVNLANYSLENLVDSILPAEPESTLKSSRDS